MIRRATAALTAALTLVAAVAGVARAATMTTASSNWAGYAVTGTTFSRVSGAWTQPAARCSATSGTTSAAFWVGLGGNSETSTALEQTGTEADCLADGTVRYTAWYELVPKASVRVPLAVAAGDRISASVRVSGTTVTVQLHDLTTGKSYARSLTMASPDVSSAAWIAEAPSLLTPRGTRLIPLTDFGTVKFTKAAAASTSGHTGSIAGAAWTATRVNLASDAGFGGGPYGRFYAVQGGATEAVASPLGSAGGSFTVTWKQTRAATDPYRDPYAARGPYGL